jgi:Photoprotection regulator fluorescence recovery protein
MQNLTWSPKEKQLARTVFKRTAVEEERELLEHFKNKSAALKNLEDLWALQYAIRDSEREYQQKYDYRYSQLIVVFGRLVREGRISIEDLNGLSEDKLKYIERIASL